MICICTSGVTANGDQQKIIALNGVNGARPLDGVGPAPEFYDHHSIAQEAAGYANLNRPYTNAEWTSGGLTYGGASIGYTDEWNINLAANRALAGGNYASANSAIDFGAFRNGLYTLVNNYTVSPGTTVNEGVTVTFGNLNTLNIPNGRLVYWTVDNPIGAGANLSSPSQGTLLVTSNNSLGFFPGTMPNFSITTALDNTTEGNGSYVVNFRQGGYTGIPFFTTPPISINDTSKYPYFGSYANNVNEGASLSLPVIGYDISASTTYYWTIDTNAAQFAVASGTVNIANNAGSFSVTPIADNTTEGGTTTFTVSLRLTSTSGLIIATTSPITINDTSKYPRFGTVPTSINEGSAGTFNLVADDIGAGGATYYWTINSQTARFGTTSGSVNIANNSGSFSVTPLANLVTDGATTFTVSLRLNSISGTVISTTGAITINDSSQTPAFTSPSGAVSISEGSAQSFSVSGYTAGANVTMYWYISHITTVAADFSGSVTDGSFTINNGGSFSITPLADSLSEGAVSGNRLFASNETFTVSIARTNRGTAIATSPIITINDTSLTAPATITWTFSSVSSGVQTINLDNPNTQGSATRAGGPYVVGQSGNIMNIVIPLNVWVHGGLIITGGASSDVVNVIVNGTLTGLGGYSGSTSGTGGSGTTALDFSTMVPTVLNLSGSGTVAGGGGAGGGGINWPVCVGGGAGEASNADVHGSPQTCNGFGCTYSGSIGFGRRVRYSGSGGSKIVTGKANNAYVGIGARQTASSGQLLGRCFSSILNRGMGGAQGGGGGLNYVCGLGDSFLGKGGTGGVGTAGGGAAVSGPRSNPNQINQSAGGGGGGWGAAGGNGFCGTANAATAGGAGGLAVKTGGKTLNSSVTNRWGSVGT